MVTQLLDWVEKEKARRRQMDKLTDRLRNKTKESKEKMKNKKYKFNDI